jgi:hypothetical protein
MHSDFQDIAFVYDCSIVRELPWGCFFTANFICLSLLDRYFISGAAFVINADLASFMNNGIFIHT